MWTWPLNYYCIVVNGWSISTSVDAGDLSLPLFCWTYQSTPLIMEFFCIDWTLPVRSWNQYNNGFNSTCQTGYSTCESDLPPHHPAPWCVVYLRVPSWVPYFSFCTAATCSWTLRRMDSARIYMLMTHRYTVLVVHRHTRSSNHASQRALIMSLSGCVEWMPHLVWGQLNAAKTEILWSATSRRLHQLPQALLRVGTDCVTPSAGNSSRLRHVDKFPRTEDSVNMFHCAEAASFHLSFSIKKNRGWVTGDVTCLSRLHYGNATLAGIPQHY